MTFSGPPSEVKIQISWQFWLKTQSMPLPSLILSVERVVLLFLSGSFLQTLRLPSRAEVVSSCHCDCDCSAAARYEGIALLSVGLLLGLLGPRLVQLAARTARRSLARLADQAEEPVAQPPLEPPPAVVRRSLADQARPIQ